MTYQDPLDLAAYAYRTGIVDRHFGRPARSTNPDYLWGYHDPDAEMPPQYPTPDTTPWPLGLRREHKARR